MKTSVLFLPLLVCTVIGCSQTNVCFKIHECLDGVCCSGNFSIDLLEWRSDSNALVLDDAIQTDISEESFNSYFSLKNYFSDLNGITLHCCPIATTIIRCQDYTYNRPTSTDSPATADSSTTVSDTSIVTTEPAGVSCTPLKRGFISFGVVGFLVIIIIIALFCGCCLYHFCFPKVHTASKQLLKSNDDDDDGGDDKTTAKAFSMRSLHMRPLQLRNLLHPLRHQELGTLLDFGNHFEIPTEVLRSTENPYEVLYGYLAGNLTVLTKEKIEAALNNVQITEHIAVEMEPNVELQTDTDTKMWATVETQYSSEDFYTANDEPSESSIHRQDTQPRLPEVASHNGKDGTNTQNEAALMRASTVRSHTRLGRLPKIPKSKMVQADVEFQSSPSRLSQETYYAMPMSAVGRVIGDLQLKEIDEEMESNSQLVRASLSQTEPSYESESLCSESLMHSVEVITVENS